MRLLDRLFFVGEKIECEISLPNNDKKLKELFEDFIVCFIHSLVHNEKQTFFHPFRSKVDISHQHLTLKQKSIGATTILINSLALPSRVCLKLSKINSHISSTT